VSARFVKLISRPRSAMIPQFASEIRNEHFRKLATRDRDVSRDLAIERDTPDENAPYGYISQMQQTR
jgi:hypothetical protein